MTAKNHWEISATCLAAFKACPTRFRLAYIEGLRPLEQTESQRQGTTWHKLLEIATSKPGEPCQVCGFRSLDRMADPDCPVCEGGGLTPDDSPLDRAVRWLDARYATVPASIEPTVWAVERVTLAYSLAGWLWLYANTPIDTVAREIKYRFPLRNPANGRALPRVERLGIIDRLVRWGDRIMVGEYKSTSKPIDSGSTYWDRLQLDGQISNYCLVARELQAAGQLTQYGITPEDPPIAGVLYDVWHKPGIKPAKLTQAETKTFLETGDYCDQHFEIDVYRGEPRYTVNGIKAEITWGPESKPKKDGTVPPRPFAIRETPDMYGARVLKEIVENPGKYFARRELPRTDADLKAFEWEMYHQYQVMRSMNKADHWWTCGNQCEATFRCQYTPICYHKQAVFDGKTCPPGFKRIYDIQQPAGDEE